MQTFDKQLPPALVSEVASQCQRKVSPDYMGLVDKLKVQFGESLEAVLLYGSCMWTQNATDDVVDLYVVVNSYKEAYPESYLQHLNAWLTPNVFSLEVAIKGFKMRSKYAVISMDDLKNGTEQWYHSYIWARFAQPMRMLYARDEKARNVIHDALARAVLTFLRASIPALNTATTDAEAIWIKGLTLTYETELRLERDTRARYLAHKNLGDFTRLTNYAAPALLELVQELPQGYYQCTTGNSEHRRAMMHWQIRRWLGCIQSVLRLIKASFTFRNCTNYTAWRIKRHTGSVPIKVKLQRHPVLFGFNVLWQLTRRGALR